MIKHKQIIFSLLLTTTLYASESSTAADVSTDLDSSSEINVGKDIYENFCANACHQIPVPGRLKPKQWRVVLNTMQVRMKSAGMTPLTEEQIEQVLAYLSQDR
jgi:cytochrome c5